MAETLFDVTHFRARQESFDWHTPAQYPDLARDVMGGIDLDPASCETANKRIKAEQYYTIEDDGLSQPWHGCVWLNPPYCKIGAVSNQETWTCKLIAEYEAGHIEQAILLVNAATETRWFQRLYAYPICFKRGKIRFISENGGKNGPTVGSAFVYFGPNEARFIQVFSKLGHVVKSVIPAASMQADLWSQSEESA